MKKFLVFLVAIIATVCIGVTFYQFAKNDEVIKVNAETIYINYGDKLSLDDIGFSRKEASKETKINFNAGGEEVTSIIKYDELSGCYIPTAKGGSTTIKITTTNRKYKSFSIDVVVGIGTEEFPYYISNETQLFDITNAHIDDGSCFELVNDINLTQPHNPIGLVNDIYREFNGKFNGGYYTISNLVVNNCDYAGLFATIGANGQVFNLNVDNAVIEGTFVNAGTIAGVCYGSINKVIVSNSTITNDKAGSNTGAVVGLLETDILYGTTANMLRTYAYTDQNKLISAKGNLGGLAGKARSAIIHASHTQLCLKNTDGISGGLVGTLMVDENTYIRESYTVAQFETKGICGNIIGVIDLDKDVKLTNIAKELVLVGLYYDNSLNTFGGVGTDANNFATASNFAVNGKTTAEMKTKDTYVYYVNDANNIVYWDKVWYLANGEYPTLIFSNGFDNIIWDDDKLPTSPDNDQTTPDISNPETPNTSVTLISNKEQLVSTFQTSKPIKGTYILTSNIDLGGMEWSPVSFSGTFKSSDKQNFTISNFKIDSGNSAYAGFFRTLSTATIKNIIFSNATINSGSNLEATGIVVGYIYGNTVIDNVDVVNSSITTSAKYAGGIAGYVGNIISKIELCNVQNITFGDSCLNVGGIVGYTSANTYVVSCKVKGSSTLSGIDRVGGIASVNRGIIYDCSFSGNIQSTSTSNAGYFGGLVAVNYSVVTNCSTFAEMSVINKSSNMSYFVGGLCGYNIGSFTNCSVYADEFNAKQSTTVVYIAGLSAYNAGKLEYCVADVLNIGFVDKYIYTAGLAVFNYGGKILGCFHFGDLSGYQVSGLIRVNTNNGIIDSCMSALNYEERSTYKGSQVASLVYEISSGTVSNCIVSANLNSTSNTGWTAGIAGFMPLTNKKYGTITHCIANVSLNGVGAKYLDIVDEGLMKSKRTTGTVTNCVISSDAKVEDVIISEYSKNLFTTKKPGSGSNYVVIDNKKLTSIDTYLNPTTCNFDISVGISTSKWLYVENLVPIPRPYVEIFGYDIIGL